MRIFILLLCLQSAALCAAPRVVTSIAPLHELTAAIMRDVGEPALIIKDQASAHHFAFKPSHMRLLQQADLVIWVGRQFEAGFNASIDLGPFSVGVGLDLGVGPLFDETIPLFNADLITLFDETFSITDLADRTVAMATTVLTAG